MKKKFETLEKINYEVIYNAGSVHGCWVHIKTKEEPTANSTYFKESKENEDVYICLRDYFAKGSSSEDREKAARFLTLQVWQICNYKATLNPINVNSLNTNNL